MKLGFVGLGNMGGRLASRLTGIGDLTVYDAFEPSMRPFAGRAVLAASLAEAGAGAEVVGVCVRTGEQVRECAAALLPVMTRGSVLMLHSTISPDLVKALARDGAPYGVDVIDTPVTVTRYDGETGPFVSVMLGGSEQAQERVRPLLAAYATGTVRVGELGSAMFRVVREGTVLARVHR